MTRSMCGAALAGFCVLFALFVMVDTATAADCAAAWDVQTCEAIVQNTTAVETMQATLETILQEPVATRDPDQHDLMELAVWGSFLTFGGVLFLIAAPIMSRAFQWWADL